jgi:Icc-related predicted phosphoesterase
MRFTLMSDLHLEFPGHQSILFPDADVLVLAGDILVAEDLRRFTRADVALPHEQTRGVSAQRYREFLDQVTQRYQHVVWVAGNHEFYHGKFLQTLDVLRQECAHYENLYFLEDRFVDVEDVRFLGGTLWTDCNRHDPQTMLGLQYGMNDYRVITNDEAGYTKLRPQHTVQRHVQTKQFIQNHITENTVVVTHHAPSFQSVGPEYKNGHELNGGYASDLHELILDHQPVYWLHGHMHTHQDYLIGETRVLCNPRGYPDQNPFWTPKTYTV